MGCWVQPGVFGVRMLGLLFLEVFEELSWCLV